MAQTHNRKMLTIITESILEKPLIAEALRCGAHGYTVHDVRGAGEHGAREQLWEADRTLEIKVICTEEVANQIADKVLATYAQNYRIAMFMLDVGVFRANKF